MTLDEARASIEDGFRVGQYGNYHQAPTGEEYVTIVSGGFRQEGDISRVLCATPEIAIQMWFDAVRKYAAPADRKTLYWRVLPELNEAYFLQVSEDGSCKLNKEVRRLLTRKVYVVYSRLLVSDKPQIQPAILPPEAALPAA